MIEATMMFSIFGIHALLFVGSYDYAVIFVFLVFRPIIRYLIRYFGDAKSVVQILVDVRTNE